jgi:PLP dependent protein
MTQVNADDVAQNLADLRARITDAGGDPYAIDIVAVTKGFGPEAVRAAYDAGLRLFGENYADELVAKAAAVTDLSAIEWQFQGRIQTNKINRLAPIVATWQSVDSIDHLQALAKRVPGARVLVQIDLGSDPGRSGCGPDELAATVAAAAELPITIEGLMCVAPLHGDADVAFGAIASLADRFDLRVRSMGMSGDLEAAVRAGSTMLRVGTALFGARAPGPPRG